MNILCVGGANDGRRVKIPDNQNYFTVACEHGSKCKPEFSNELYVVERIKGEDETFYTARHRTITVDQMLGALIGKYQPNLVPNTS